MRPLSYSAASTRENATGPRCQCRCGGCPFPSVNPWPLRRLGPVRVADMEARGLRLRWSWPEEEGARSHAYQTENAPHAPHISLPLCGARGPSRPVAFVPEDWRPGGPAGWGLPTEWKRCAMCEKRLKLGERLLRRLTRELEELRAYTEAAP